MAKHDKINNKHLGNRYRKPGMLAFKNTGHFEIKHMVKIQSAPNLFQMEISRQLFTLS